MKKNQPNTALLGNQFWKMRSKHGRDKIFKEPQTLWDAACEYFEYTDARNTWDKEDFRGKDAKKVTIKRKIPYTLSGLCIFLGVNEDYITDFQNDIKDKAKKNKKDKDFLRVIADIRAIIWTQKFEGASVGEFNSNIISMELGMKAKIEANHTFEQPLFHEDGEDGVKD